MARQRQRIASARAYYRLAAKADRSGNYAQATQYRNVADRLVAADQREQQSRKSWLATLKGIK